MIRLLTMLVVGAALLVPAIAAYVVVPAAAVATWPALVIVMLPALATLVAGVVFFAWRVGLEEPLATTAVEWLRAELARSGKVGINVATRTRGERNHESFYHPASQTIVLADSVVDQHTARAHATAAHELGHALLHLARPGLSRTLMFAREHAEIVLHTGAGALAGAILVGNGGLRLAAVALIAVGFVLHALTLVDEVIASATARDRLRDHLSVPEHARTAHAHLRRALSTYVLRFVGVAGGLAIAVVVALRGGDGVLVPAPPPVGKADLAADVIAVVTVAAAALALLRTPWASDRGPLVGASALVQTAGLVWSPLMVCILCGQPAPAWTIALGAVTTFLLMSAPALIAVSVLASFLVRGLADLELPLTIGALRTRSVSASDLARHEPPSSFIGRLAAATFALWPAPLAIWWLS